MPNPEPAGTPPISHQKRTEAIKGALNWAAIGQTVLPGDDKISVQVAVDAQANKSRTTFENKTVLCSSGLPPKAFFHSQNSKTVFLSMTECNFCHRPPTASHNEDQIEALTYVTLAICMLALGTIFL